MIMIVNIYLLYARHCAQTTIVSINKWILELSLKIYFTLPGEMCPTMRIVCVLLLSHGAHVCMCKYACVGGGLCIREENERSVKASR